MQQAIVEQDTKNVSVIPEAIDTEEFKLEMLDCGPAYTFGSSGTVCFSCFCGGGCLCGTPSA